MLCARCAAEQHDETASNRAEERPSKLANEWSNGVRACARCGARLPASGARIVGTVVESTAERGPISAELPLPSLDSDLESLERDAPGGLMVTRPSLPTLLWRQPVVRAAARAGASAVALTLGMRLLRGWLRMWLRRPRTARGVATTAVPLVRQLFDQPVSDLPRPGRRRAFGRARDPLDGDEVVETFIYVRRVLRRR